MSNLPQEELLSAYLDGELTAEQKVQVDKLLAEDPSAQATLDGLRAVSSAVKDLPAFKLQENLATEVLKTAERRMLADTLPTAKADDKTVTEPLWQTLARRFLTPRAIAWSTAIALVAIIITYQNREEDKPGPHGPIAMDMKVDRPADEAKAMRGPGEFRAPPAISPPPSPAESAPKSIAKEEFATSEQPVIIAAKKSKSAPPTAKSPAPKSPAAKPLIAASPAKESFDKAAMKSAAKRSDNNRHLTAKDDQVELKQQAMPGMGMGGTPGGMGGGMGSGMGGGMKMGKGAPMPLAEKDDQGQIRRKAGYNGRSAKSWTDGKLAGPGAASAGEQQTVTVSCFVDSRPAAQKALKQILIAQKLLPRPSTALNQSAQPQKPAAKQPDSERETEQGEATQRGRGAESFDYIPKQKNAKRDSISIELTTDQLDQVVAEIRKQPDIFAKCEIEPAPTAAQPRLSGLDDAIPPMRQQAQTAPAQMPQDALGRIVNFKVVFLFQPNPPQAAEPQKAKAAQQQ